MKEKKLKKLKYIKKGEKERVCIFCGNPNATIRKYGLSICRRCFREKARQLGFKKFG